MSDDPFGEMTLAEYIESMSTSSPETLVALVPHQIDDLIGALDEAVQDGTLDAEIAGEMRWRLLRLQDIAPRALAEPVIKSEANRLMQDFIRLVALAVALGKFPTT